ncbi:MAG TPA: hypothetical protein ENK57_09555 [Polyangiaceae bacterium]|nr:hypothetical protein [Polyangiaceae bacterium]
MAPNDRKRNRKNRKRKRKRDRNPHRRRDRTTDRPGRRVLSTDEPAVNRPGIDRPGTDDPGIIAVPGTGPGLINPNNPGKWTFPSFGLREQPFDTLDNDIPVLFFPVRLETRFVDPKDGQEVGSLKVRIYPDDAHIDDHSLELTAKEHEIGAVYWASWDDAQALTDEAEREAAEDAAREWLTLQLPARRAAWVAQQTKAGAAPTISDVARPAVARCLPVRWALVGFQDVGGVLTQVFTEWTGVVRADLKVGVDFGEYGTSTSGGLPVDDGMKWMVDYDEAVAAGMAVTIDLDKYPDVWTKGLDVLLAVGVSTKRGDDADAELTELLQAHHYSEGLAFAPQGVPTNNTDEVDSPWSFREVDPLALLARELDGEDAASGSKENGKRLGVALGRPDDPLLDRLEHANLDEETGQQAMNEALWPVTFGQYFDVLMAGEDGDEKIPSNAVSYFRARFEQDVRGGGPLPAIRVGAQPYGLLPVRFSEPTQPNEQWVDATPWFEDTLHFLRSKWLDAKDDVVPKLDPVLGASGGTASNDPDSVLTEILSTLPHPKRFLLRGLTSWRETDTEEFDEFGDIFGALLFPFLYFPDPIWGYEALSVLGRWGWALAVLGDMPLPAEYAFINQAGIPSEHLATIDDPSLRDADAQIDALRDLRGRVSSLVRTDMVGTAEAWIDSLIVVVEQHRDRQAPYTEWGTGSVDMDGIIADEIDDPTIFYSVYDRDEDTKDFQLPLVHSDVSSTATYLSNLRDRVETLTLSEEGPLLGCGALGSGTGPGTMTRRSRRTSSTRALRTTRSMSRPLSSARRATPNIIDDVVDGGPTPGLGGLATAFHDAPPLLYQLLDSVVDDIPKLKGAAYRGALSQLADLDEETLELRLRETLGLATNRLDAYFTSLASMRLDEVREQATGIQLGGYGWVVDLKRDGKAARDSQGFIHAPSMPQAVTAAILRSGWSAHGDEDEDSKMAVDLSGERVRLAAWLLDGVRQGQSLGELLGYRFERALHDAKLDVWIDPVRRAVLLADGKTRDPRGPVDGLALLDLWATTGTGASLLAAVDPAYKSGDESVIEDHVDAIAEALDAAGDAAIAESVHQVAQGNMTRAAATLDAMNQGEVAPPELLSMQTPRQGVGIVHRVAVLLNDEGGSSGWASTPRAQLDPRLEAWASDLLGPASAVTVRWRTKDADGVASGWSTVTMAQLQLAALDAVFEAPAAGSDGDTRWNRRVEAFVRDGLADQDVTVEIQSDDQSALSFDLFAEAARAVRAVLARARAMDARDLAPPDADADAGLDLNELESRVTTLVDDFRAAATALTDLLPTADATQEDPHPRGTAATADLRSAMLGLVHYALVGAIPVAGRIGDEADVAALWAEAWSLGDKAASRIETLDAVQAEQDDAVASGEELTDAQRLGWAKARIGATVGRAFPAVPMFTVADPTTITTAFDKSGTWTGDDPATIASWMSQVSRVRPETAGLMDAIEVTELVRDRTTASFTVAQLPDVTGDPWVAMGKPARGPEGESTGGRVHWIAVDHGGLGLIGNGTGCGLMIDEWTERIPKTKQTTGVAFHFDSPSSRAPNALLLAVTPDGQTPWDFSLIVSTLMQTLEDAQIRAVGPQSLAAYGHHLPAIFPPKKLKTS